MLAPSCTESGAGVRARLQAGCWNCGARERGPNTMHSLVCRVGDKWGVYCREHPTVPWSMQRGDNILRSARDLALAFDPLQFNWTFSERRAEIVMTDLNEESEQIANATRGLDITIYCPEGRAEPDDRWGTLHRLPNGQLWSAGLSWLFRPKSLRQQI